MEQLLLRDVLEHTGSTTVERPLAAEVLKHAEILNDVGMESAPALKGYVRFISKPTAETILQLDRHDPLLARWQYGLGRSAVFASDAKTRWAADWVTWKGYDKFWTNLCRDLLPRAQGGEASVEYDSANGDLVVEYRLGRGVPEPDKIPDVYAFGPDGFQQPVPVKKIAAGTFRGRLPIGSRQGLFRVRTAEESRAFPEAGLYRPEAELADYGSNEALLKQVADVYRRPFPARSGRGLFRRRPVHRVVPATVAGIAGARRAAEPGGAGAAQMEGRDGARMRISNK